METTFKKSVKAWSKMLLMAAILCFSVTTLFSYASAAGLLDKIKKEKKLVVGTEAAFEPFEFVQDGKIVGYGKDILDYLAADLDVELVQHDVPFQGIIAGLLAKKFDFVATSIAINEERLKKVAFTLPIAMMLDEIIVLSKNDNIKGTEDLNNKIVGGQLNSAAQTNLEKFNLKLKAKGGAGYKDLKLYTAQPELYMALASGQIEAICIPTLLFLNLNKKQPGVFKSVGGIGRTLLCWITRPEDLDLRDYINSVILKLRDSGKLYELQKKWLGITQEIPDSGHLPPGAF